jgi:hypothetical protein
MTPEFKSSWLAALRDGSHKQGHKALKDGCGGFCCLGVGLDLIDPDGWHGEAQEIACRKLGFGWKGFGPAEIYRVAKVLQIDASEAHKLAAMNDGLDDYKVHSFDEIAAYIELTVAADGSAGQTVVVSA